MSMVKPAHGDVIAQETINGTMHLLRILEKALFYGRSDLSPLQFDGFEKMLLDSAPSQNIIDLRGKPLSEDVLQDGALTVQDAPNFGTPTHLYTSPKVKADLVKQFFPKERYDLFQKTSNGMIGLDIKGFTSAAGDVAFEPDVFITDGGAPTPAVGDISKRPGLPTVSTAPVPAASGSSMFEVDDAGDYFYKIQAVNRYGRSGPVDLVTGPVAAVTVDAGEKVPFGMTPGVGGDVDYYEIYRTKKDGAVGTTRSILRIPNAAGAGEQLIEDYNVELPGTTSAFLFQQNTESMSLKQLAPMIKIPLATIDARIRWMQLLYCVPTLYIPGKNVLYKNVGRAAGFVGGA